MVVGIRTRLLQVYIPVVDMRLRAERGMCDHADHANHDCEVLIFGLSHEEGMLRRYVGGSDL